MGLDEESRLLSETKPPNQASTVRCRERGRSAAVSQLKEASTDILEFVLVAPMSVPAHTNNFSHLLVKVKNILFY